jgi:hypothetical protein
MGNLDNFLLDEDIGGFVGMFFYNTIEDIKDNCDIMSDIFCYPESYELGDSILLANWKKWTGDNE